MEKVTLKAVWAEIGVTPGPWAKDGAHRVFGIRRNWPDERVTSTATLVRWSAIVDLIALELEHARAGSLRAAVLVYELSLTLERLAAATDRVMHGAILLDTVKKSKSAGPQAGRTPPANSPD